MPTNINLPYTDNVMDNIIHDNVNSFWVEWSGIFKTMIEETIPTKVILSQEPKSSTSQTTYCM